MSTAKVEEPVPDTLVIVKDVLKSLLPEAAGSETVLALPLCSYSLPLW